MTVSMSSKPECLETENGKGQSQSIDTCQSNCENCKELKVVGEVI